MDLSGLESVLDVTTALAALVGAALFWLRRSRLVRARDPKQEGQAQAAVSIIVPARDEAQNLPTLLGSLATLQPPPLEIIVVDDHSSDGTAAIARQHGARVIAPGALPQGFVGKTWACVAGAQAARGAYLLFTDADTWHAPDSLARALRALEDTGAGLLSVIPTHRIERGWERLQGVFQLLLLFATRAGARDRGRVRARRYANGQYLLFQRASYEAVGGHRAVRGFVAEDLAFAQRAAELGQRVHVLFAPDALRVRMYPEGFAAFFAGWRRNFRDGMRMAGGEGVLEMVMVMIWLLGVPMLLIADLIARDASSAAMWLAAYGATALLLGRAQRGLGVFPWWSALLYPVFTSVFVAVSLCSSLDGLRRAPVRWRGREIEAAR